MSKALSIYTVIRAVAVVALVAGNTMGDDPTFLEFPDDEVATPVDLVESIHAINSILSGQEPPASFDPRTFWPNDRGGSNDPRKRPKIPTPRGNRPTPSQLPNRTTNPPRSPSRPPMGRPSVNPPNGRRNLSQRERTGLDRRIAEPSRRLAESLLNSNSTSRRSNDQQDSPPQGSFRDRLNRILLDAAQNSFEQKTDDKASLSIFERAFSKAADSMEEQMDGKAPGWRKRVANQWNRATARVRRSRDESDNWLRRAAPASSGAEASNGMTTWWLAGLALLIIAAGAFLARRRIAAYLGNHPRLTVKRLRFALRKIDSRRDLIAAVDRFLLWSLGSKSTTWNCKMMRQSLATTYPQLRPQIEDLVDDYELARYAPDSTSISPTQLRRCSMTLKHLVAVETANGG